ncbi:hypothetical protein AM588_10003329 [Phytophthora nicotianae]|uniref:mitogen-activated protein kinase kinase n=1 Tax=Phytophthora nicotianae TaxID=4792 RepID=A0A0W8D267_PHYNI|nr:hypothetical protein AM588_10003329 [Phytophthora nicotianae]
MKTRPVLSVVASDHDLDYKHDYEDKFEASCDIGETTLYKAGLRINSSGVTFADDKAGHKEEDDEVDECVVESRKLVALDKLVTISMIGRGSSGQVFKARHCESNALYAVKVVTNVFDKPRRDQLLTEIHQLLAKLPKDDDVVPERVIAAIAMQILTGLAHLQLVRHVHRDIKPQNILVQQDGAVKLTDFGLARELSSSTSMAQTFVGTFKYMAPERVQNEPYDYKSDIWSLGLVLIECATQTFPYANARSYIDVVQSIVESPEPSLPEDDANGKPFTPEFHDFIGRCLKKEPSERASVEELLNSRGFSFIALRALNVQFVGQLHLVNEEASEAKELCHEEQDAKELKAKQHDDEEEIEEAIEVGQD